MSLEPCAILQSYFKIAWEHFIAEPNQCGTRTFTELLKNAGMDSPFDGDTLKNVAEVAKNWLDSYDLTGIE